MTDGPREAVLTLMAPGWQPPDCEVTQSYGICFTESGSVVLVTDDGRDWTLPGGTIEEGESPEQALVREVAEEACADVVASRYLACQHVWDPGHPDGRVSYYQTRWWARVALNPWDPQFEMVERMLVGPEDVPATLFWREKTIASRLVELALAEERRLAP